MIEQHKPPIKLVMRISSTHGATPVRIHIAANGKEVILRANLRPFRITPFPIKAPTPAPSIDNDAIHDASCCVTERDDLEQTVKFNQALMLFILITFNSFFFSFHNRTR